MRPRRAPTRSSVAGASGRQRRHARYPFDLGVGAAREERDVVGTRPATRARRPAVHAGGAHRVHEVVAPSSRASTASQRGSSSVTVMSSVIPDGRPARSPVPRANSMQVDVTRATRSTPAAGRRARCSRCRRGPRPPRPPGHSRRAATRAGPTAWASLSIDTLHPAPTTCSSSRIGGSSRSGRQLISTALSKCAHTPNTRSASNVDSGRPLPEHHAAGAVAEDVGVRVRHRRDHAVGHRLLAHAQLRVHAGDDDVELGEQVVVLVEAAVVEDVDLDAGEDAERRELLVERRDHARAASRSRSGVEAVGDA